MDGKLIYEKEKSSLTEREKEQQFWTQEECCGAERSTGEKDRERKKNSVHKSVGIDWETEFVHVVALGVN